MIDVTRQGLYSVIYEDAFEDWEVEASVRRSKENSLKIVYVFYKPHGGSLEVVFTIQLKKDIGLDKARIIVDELVGLDLAIEGSRHFLCSESDV